MVRVDSVVLPNWATDRHHYVFMNYLALEHPKVRQEINFWIDLMFGEKQQKHEYFNLFKPLTSEVFLGIFIMKKRNMLKKEKKVVRIN